MNKNNKGFSLVELVVVIAILGICAAITTLSLSSIASSRAARCAAEIDALLSRCRVSAMASSGQVYLKLYQVGDLVYGELYQDGGELVSQDELCADAALSYQVGDEVRSAETGLYIAFDRGTGALVGFGANLSAVPSETVSILVSSGGRNVEIGIVALTGYHWIGG